MHRLDHAIEQVAVSPHQWPQFLSGTRRYVFPKYPFSLIYFVESDTIHIVAVAHENRKPGYWRKRLR